MPACFYTFNLICWHSTELIGGYFAPQTVVEMNKPGCAICEFVMHRLREWLQDGHTQDEIQEELREMCGLMPSSLKVSGSLVLLQICYIESLTTDSVKVHIVIIQLYFRVNAQILWTRKAQQLYNLSFRV